MPDWYLGLDQWPRLSYSAVCVCGSSPVDPTLLKALRGVNLVAEQVGPTFMSRRRHVLDDD